MKIRSNTREGNKIILEVEEDYSEFLKSVDKTIIEAGKEVKIPGFRPGKAPKAMVEKVLNREFIEAQAAQDLISAIYPRILDEIKIEPVDYPNLQILDKKKKKPIVYKIEIEVYPEVKLGKYKGLRAEKKEVKVTDEDVNKVLENLQKRLAHMEGGEPAIDDEFAKKVSKYQTLEELKKEFRTGMQKDKEGAEEADVKNKLIAEASKNAKVDIPNGMVKREIDVMLDELRNSLAQSGLTLEDYLKGIKKDEKLMREELHKSAEVRVIGKVVLKAIAETEKIEISKEEMDEELKELAKAAGQPVEEAGKEIDEHAKKYVEDYLMRRKALDFILEKAKVTTVENKPLDETRGEEEKND
ncbi:MAG: trigger factor [Candidatus Margulisiibacteriota bacterium]|nr:trigger factor [Candidatus Margulisiibacteriota bacterium]